ncbi:MAG: aminotransferase class I/II-fold pyridoxal phosphate-dependent enzyme [Acutalibacteraceae bacterium]|nr:aminotransferase class I/II-fold pyridoxal phosphate-dependent enzyme [Acutalibacteraceae bacterium]
MIDYNSFINEKIRTIKPSGIRKFFDIASEMDNVISLSIGEPDFKTPWHVREEGIRSLQQGNTKYTSNKGLTELRNEICKYFERRYNVKYSGETDCVVTVGGSEAIDLVMRTLISEGDEVLIPEPSFVCYTPLVQMADGIPIAVETKEEDNFKLTPELLEKAITPRSKLLVLPFPNNPTGAIMEKEDLQKIAEVVLKHNLFVLSDEIYAELTYNNKNHVSFASIDGMKERTAVVSGFSKAYSMTGWRLGYALAPKPITDVITKLHQFAIMSAPTTAQYAAIEALKNGDNDIAKMRDEYDMRRRLVVKRFREMGLSCFEPEGAFYAFPCIKSTGLSSEEFCMQLLKSKNVAVVPGNAFGESGEGFVRVSYSFSIKHIIEALNRVEEFLQEIKENN